LASLPAPNAAGQRDKLIDSIGNLTLLTHELNKTTANRPWTDAEARGLNLGKSGKRSEILRTSRLSMNADLVAAHPESWAEADIRRRTAALVAAAIEIWRPPPARSSVSRPLPDPELEVEPPPRVSNLKYEAVTTFLGAQSVATLKLTFAELEDVLGFPLAPTARVHRRYWTNRKSALARAVAAGGYRVTDAEVATEVLTFTRVKVDRLPRPTTPAATTTATPRRPARPRRKAARAGGGGHSI
jgi:hypothetical protein